MRFRALINYYLNVPIRYILLSLNLVAVGVCLFAANRATELSSYGRAGLFGAILAGSITSVSLALFSLRSMGFIYITRPISFVLAFALIFVNNSIAINIGLLCIFLIHTILFSETLISKLTRDIGSSGEFNFILKTPTPINIWFVFTWFVFWASFVEALHLFIEKRTLLGVLSLGVALIIFIVFVAAQTRTLFRRCVIVPNGIVASDPITLTDVLLFPLAKVKAISVVPNVDTQIRASESVYISRTSNKNLVLIKLNEKTDSLIERNTAGQSTRKNVDSIYLPIMESELFSKTFHSRFHKAQPKPLTKSQEKMLEKELGIETAPRSDSPLPKWRTKKSK